MVMKNTLSKSKQKILTFLREAAAQGQTPTVREICEATGLKSTSTVHGHLKDLAEAGYLSMGKGHRAIRMTEQNMNIEVPLIGRVTAGMPILAFEDVMGSVPFSAAKAAGRELFALHVQGESMHDIGIYDGDVVICEKTPYAENGDIVVAMIEDEATVKSFYREEGYYRLQPHNPDFEPILTKECSILGKVISLIREY